MSFFLCFQERKHAAALKAALHAQRKRGEQEQRRQAEELRARGQEALKEEVSRLQHDHKQSLLQAQSQSTQVGLLTNQFNVVGELEEEQKTGSTLDWLTI